MKAKHLEAQERLKTAIAKPIADFEAETGQKISTISVQHFRRVAPTEGEWLFDLHIDIRPVD